jgi:Beta-propeller repeat
MSKNASRRMLVLLPFLVGFAFPAAAAAEACVSEAYGTLPLHFEENRGQTHEDVRFLARGPGYSLFLTATDAVLTLIKPESIARKPAARGRSGRGPATGTVLRMTFADANPAPRVAGLEELPGKANYFIGNDAAKWRTSVPTYAKVHYREVYPGIDLVYYGKQRQLEYDFVVRPGADLSAIALHLTGADKVEVDVQGDLVMHTAAGPMRQRKPLIYQEVGGVRKEIQGGYVLKGKHQVGFRVAAHDASQPLVIDPVLVYSTYLGGSGEDRSPAIAVDADGNAYVTGMTFSPDFPTTAGAFQTSFGDGSFHAFVTKLNPTGSALVYSTYLGGSGAEAGYGIAVDPAGNAFVTGNTNSSNFPTTTTAAQTTYGGGLCCDAFVTQLDAAGSALVYSTYLGGSGDDEGNAIAVDPAGNAYVTGLTSSTDFPTTAGAFQTTLAGGFDAFVTKLNPAGSVSLVYSTYLGSGGGSGIAADASGNAYVTGSTDSTNFPTTKGAFQTIYGGGISDGFVTKLDPTGAVLVYSTYLGGSGEDGSSAIAVDADGSAYMTGGTFSPDFPTTMGAFQTIYGGGSSDAFVTKLDPSGSALVYSTNLGGSGGEEGHGIAVDSAGNAFVAGNTNSSNFPTTVTAFQTTYGGGACCDAFVTKLDAAGSALVYSTYLGGSGNDGGSAIAVDASANAYVTGFTESGDFPTTAGVFQTSNARISDAFVAKITEVAPPPPCEEQCPPGGQRDCEQGEGGGEGDEGDGAQIRP